MISVTPEIRQAIAENAVVAIAVSGGKDSSIAALAVSDYLDQMGHAGERILIHSDLGSVEWEDSLPMCEKLADRLGLELVVVRRKAGGMMQRWQTRWENNVRRYKELSCVKLILPWSTPDMRFCTSELKTAVICSELNRRYKGKTILNVTGVRRDESNNRKNAPIAKTNTRLTKKDGTIGYDWNAIAEMLTEDVFLAHKSFNFPLHSAYTEAGCSRVSCKFCIMGKWLDLQRASRVPANLPVYIEMCLLELMTAFSFQSSRWLSDVAPDLLPKELQLMRAEAKEKQRRRNEIEAQIPKHLLYTKNFPKCIPNWSEAELLCEVRLAVAELYGWQVDCIDPRSLIRRYEELMEEKHRREARARMSRAVTVSVSNN